MSSQNTAQTRYNACLSQVRQAALARAGELQEESARISSAILARAMSAVSVSTGTLDALWTRARTEVPALDRVLGTVAAPQFRQATDLAARATAAAAAGARDASTLAKAASDSLVAALGAGAAELSHRERAVVTDVLAESARALNYTVTRHDGAGASAIEARRDHEVLLVRVVDGGGVEMDRAGLAGAACLQSQSELEAEAARRGVDLVSAGRTVHGSTSGGVLIAAAARRGARSLAEGTVLAHDQARGGSRSSLYEPAPRRVTAKGEVA